MSAVFIWLFSKFFRFMLPGRLQELLLTQAMRLTSTVPIYEGFALSHATQQITL
jgi:hypothetical protein